MNKSPVRALLIGGLFTVTAIVSAVTCLDQPLALFLHGYRATPWVAFFARITNLANGAIWYTLAVLGILAATLRHHLTGDRAVFLRRARAGAFMIAAMASSGILINVLKAIIGRERPRALFSDGTMDLHPLTLNIADSSFPSGHTQSIWAAMLALSMILPPLRPLFLFVALMISASRVIIAAHYFSDVVGGAYFGIAAVVLWRAWFERGGIPLSLTPTSPSAPAVASPPPATSS